jgi:hypothetical protein
LQVAQLHHTALNTTPYATLIAQVQAFIPRGARVIGMHHYGFGWEGYAYRSLAVPLLLVNPELETPPIALTDALDAQRPAFLLIDARMRAYLENDSRGSRKAFWDWMTARKAARIGSVDDKTYGAIEIYRVRE